MGVLWYSAIITTWNKESKYNSDGESQYTRIKYNQFNTQGNENIDQRRDRYTISKMVIRQLVFRQENSCGHLLLTYRTHNFPDNSSQSCASYVRLPLSGASSS